MKNKLRHWNQDNFLRHTLITVVGTKLGDIFNFIYRLVLVRLLTESEYGILSPLISFSLIFCQFVSPFQPALTKFIAGYIGQEETGRTHYLIKRAWRDLSVFALVVFILIILASTPLAGFLKVADRSYLIIMTGVLIVASILTAVPGAFMQGAQLFTLFASIGALSTFLKMLVGIGLIYLGFTVGGGLLGFVVAPLVFLVAGIFVVAKYFSRHRTSSVAAEPFSMVPIYKYFVPTGLMLGSFWALTNIDVVLVRHFYPAKAGLYSWAQLVGLIILFLPAAVPIVIFPKAASAQTRNLASRPLLMKGLIVTALLCGLGTLICGIVPGLILKLLAGTADPESVRLVVWFALAMSFYALAMLVIFYHLAVHNTKIVLPLVLLAIAETITIYLYHPTLLSVLLVLLAYSILTFLVSLIVLKYAPEISPLNTSREASGSAEMKNGGQR